MNPEIYALLTRIPFVGLVICGFSFMLLVTGFLGYVVIDIVRNLGKPEPNSWASLAKTNDLSFKPGTFSTFGSGAHVVGDYRNHHLKLEIFTTLTIGYSPLQTQINTRLTLSSKDSATNHSQSNNQDIVHKPKSADDMISFLAPNGLHYEWKGAIKAKDYGRKIYYEHYGVENDEEYLQTLFDLMSVISDAYPKVLALGGESVSTLESIAGDKNQLQLIATQLIQDIGRETTKRLGKRRSLLLCPRCFVRCAVHKARSQRWQTITYYGCRHCRQSSEFIDLEGQVIAVLDSKSPMRLSEQAGQVRINWFAHSEPFDFDGVEIIWATDEDVERFAMKLGNDTDPIRQPRYKQMRCWVSSTCGLSENPMKILRKIFGQVEVK